MINEIMKKIIKKIMKKNKRNDEIIDNTTMKFDAYECTRGGM